MTQMLELPVSELKTALTGLHKVLNPRSALPVLGCVRVSVEPDGHATLQTTDLDSFATCRLPVSGEATLKPCLVSFAALQVMVKSARDRLALIREEDGSMRVRTFVGSHPLEQPIETQPVTQWPPLPVIPSSPAPVVDGFKTAFQQALDCASVESSRTVLQGAFLDVSAKGHYLVGTNGRHLFAANTFQLPLRESVIVPHRKFLLWPTFAADGPWQLRLEPGGPKKPAWVELRSEHWTFVTKPIEGPYPNWRNAMPPEEGRTRARFSEEAIQLMLEALPRMPVSDEFNQPVTLDLTTGRPVLRSRTKGDGTVTEVPVPDVDLMGPGFAVTLNRTYLLKALRFGCTTLDGDDDRSPVLFSAHGRKLVIMPIHHDAAPAPKSTPPPEAAAATTPSDAQANTPTEPVTPTMANTRNTTPITPKPPTEEPPNGSPLKQALDHLETLRGEVREFLGRLNTASDLLKAAEKEKKASFKEVESVRATLRSLQKVAI